MMFTAHYQSPLGEILLAADEVGLTGLWFDRAKYYAAGLAPQSTERETPPLTEAKRWLDVYFSGKMPDFMPPLHPIGSDFRQEVWALLEQHQGEQFYTAKCLPFLLYHPWRRPCKRLRPARQRGRPSPAPKRLAAMMPATYTRCFKSGYHSTT
mgnify:CR=1 FL=1